MLVSGSVDTVSSCFLSTSQVVKKPKLEARLSLPNWGYFCEDFEIFFGPEGVGSHKKKQELIQGVHPRRLTWNLRIHSWKRKIIFQTIIFRFYVNLRGCKSFFLSHTRSCSRFLMADLFLPASLKKRLLDVY